MKKVQDYRIKKALAWLETIIGDEISTVDISPVSSDASFRRYFRISSESYDNPLILMDSPPEKEPLGRFLSCCKILRELDLKVPFISNYDENNGFMLLEDFGNTTLHTHLAEHKTDQKAVYFNAIDQIIKMQSKFERNKKIYISHFKTFSKKLLTEELSLFKYWYLQTHLGLKLDLSFKKNYEDFGLILINSMQAESQTLVHRDFHSKNLMILRNQQGIGVLDFQDALIGPSSYDLVSLLKDAYTNIKPKIVTDCLIYFYKKTNEENLLDLGSFESFTKNFHLTAIQRNLKIIGIFSRLKYRDNKPNYMKFIGRVNARTMEISGQIKELDFLKNFLREIDSNPIK